MNAYKLGSLKWRLDFIRWRINALKKAKAEVVFVRSMMKLDESGPRANEKFNILIGLLLGEMNYIKREWLGVFIKPNEERYETLMKEYNSLVGEEQSALNMGTTYCITYYCDQLIKNRKTKRGA